MFLNINKPTGMTSHDVVDYVRKLTGERRVGHGGTLDPFASGVLVVGVGRESTKQLSAILKDTQKEYRAALCLGKTSSTGDPEGALQIVPFDCAQGRDCKLQIDEATIEQVLERFRGEIIQTPPPYSAVKVGGVPAYKRARRGEKVQLFPRTVTIFVLELIDFSMPSMTLRVACSSGTYIRVLAEDIGKALGVGAYLTALVRTRVGEYGIEESLGLEDLKDVLDL